MKTAQIELIAAPQFDSGRWKLRLERALLSANKQSDNIKTWTPIVESGNQVVRLIADGYLSPNKTLSELHQMMDSNSIDALRAFSEACRAEIAEVHLI